ncbi:MAG: flippase-like domain-containing protein [Magnetococcales bacterium]|nr:flippase-like domain-containing protein [Magnetococcales bacterium]
MQVAVARWGWMLFKLLVAGGVVWFLVSQGKLDLSIFLDGGIGADIVVVALICNFAMISLTSLRWQFLLASQKISLPFSWVHSITYLSMFFNLLIPGSVGGEALRLNYTFKSVPGRKSAVILTVFADRVIGLYGLFVLSLVGLLISLPTVMAVTPLKVAMVTITAIVVGGPLFAILLLLLLPRISWLRSYIYTPQDSRVWSIINSVVDVLRHFIRAKLRLLFTLLISISAHTIEVFALIWIAMRLDMMAITVEGFYVATPLAWMANIIPISPGGIGVGEVAFDQICHWLQPTQAAVAFSTIFFINRIFMMVASLPGFFVYIFYKQKNLVST